MTLSVKKLIPHTWHQKPLAVAIALSAISASPAAFAQETKLQLEEVVVSARKRTESLQDVPISLQALGSDQLTNLGVSNFEDYAAMLPSLSYTSIGPGTASLYFRGASDGGDGNSSGSQPSVGVYFDEQPVTSIGGSLDVHVYDIERIEALAGPQGTLYGASSQSGTLRIITKKPDATAFEAGVDLGYATIDDGDDSYSVEGFANIPINDKAAIRLVGWDTEDGGWIDNVAATRTYELEGGYGYDPAPTPGGRQTTINNNHVVEKDQNIVENTGFRAALRVDLNDNWVATASVMTQEQNASGSFDSDLDQGDYENIKFHKEYHDDEFTQYALVLEGELAGHSLIYAGSYMEREVDIQYGYSAYGEEAYWVPYYACDYYAATPCSDINESYTEDNDYDRTSHELRLQSLGDGALHYTAGLYFEEQTHEYLQEWVMPGMSPTLWARGKKDIFYTTDQERTSEQTAVFGELTYDFSDTLNTTVGVRSFDNEDELKGYTGWGNANYQDDYGINVDSKTDDQDEVYKVNLTWNASEDVMLYTTWSEGYRAGGVNRDATAPQATYTPDILTSIEFGWKTTLLDGRLRWNGAVYNSTWDDMQFTIYAFALSGVANTYNAGESEITGIETDFTYLVSESLILSGSAAYQDAETNEDFILGAGTLVAEKGTDLPNVPDLKYNLTARYEFNAMEMDSYAQLAYSYTDGSWNQLQGDSSSSKRREQDDFSSLNFRTGFSSDSYGVDLYINNLSNENDNISVYKRPYQNTATSQQPRTVGVKLSMKFN